MPTLKNSLKHRSGVPFEQCAVPFSTTTTCNLKHTRDAPAQHCNCFHPVRLSLAISGYLPAISRLSSHIDGFWPGYLSAISRLSSAILKYRWILGRLSPGYLPAIFGYHHISMDLARLSLAISRLSSGYLSDVFQISFGFVSFSSCCFLTCR